MTAVRTHTPGRLTALAMITEVGQMRAYADNLGLTGDVALSGITGTPTHNTPRTMNSAWTDFLPSTAETFAYLRFTRALDLAELDLISAKLRAGTYS